MRTKAPEFKTAEFKAKKIAARKKWYAANPDRVRDRELRRSYGITLEEYQLRMKAQHNMCAICKKVASGKGQRLLQVDHDHGTGKVRELLCGGCNTLLGGAKDDPQIVFEALQYLYRHGRGIENYTTMTC